MDDIDRAAVFYRTLRGSVNDTDWGIHTEIRNNHDNTLTVICRVAAKEVIKKLRRRATVGVSELPLVTCTVTTKHSDYNAVLDNTVLNYSNQSIAEILNAQAHLHGVPSLCARQPDHALCLHALTEYPVYTLITVDMLARQLQALAQTHLSAQLPLIPAENILFN